MKEYYVYILAGPRKERGPLYIGVTSWLERRIIEHKVKAIDGFTAKYNLGSLMYYEITNDPKEALLREKQLKKWNRQWKINLIDKSNPEWKDLFIE